MKLVMDWTDEDGEQNDDVCRISVDGQPIIEANHDDHGWEGMRAIRDTAGKLAAVAGWSTEIIGRPGI